MQLNDYQVLANRTSAFQPTKQVHHNHVTMAAFGLAGETGEVLDLLKKHYFHGHQLDKKRITDEIGDVLWYIAEICTALHLSLDEVAVDNIAKLKARYGKAFSTEKSINRKD